MRHRNALDLSLVPLLPMTVSLIVGIVVGCPFPAAWWGVATLALLIAATLAARRWPALQTAGCCLCFVVVGMMVAPDEQRHVEDGTWTEAVVASVPAERPKTYRVELLLPATGEQRRCYIWKDNTSRQLQIGDNLLVSINNGQFVRYGDWQYGGQGWQQLSHVQRLRLRALQWRSPLLARLLQTGGNEEAQAIVAAMTLGDKSLLTHELRERYSIAGASHVLALSGLHLSIIYMLLTMLALGRRRFWVIQVLVVLAIWAFALLTGLSVSIVRAATMISIYALFALSGRRHAALNVLCFTALVMLLVDSRALFDVSFQLSFMSMLGILLFVPLFESYVSLSWMMAHPIVRWLFSLMAVSLSAQLGTAPLVAYYFGHFSTWFLLTNIIVVPLATVLIGSALLALAIPALGGIAIWIADLQNHVLDWIQSWPLASVEGLSPSVLQVAMCYVAIGAVYLLLIYTRSSAGYR